MFDLCNPMDCILPGSSIHGIFQARILEWVAISFFRGSSQPRYSPYTTVETLAFTCGQIHHYWLKSNGSSFLWICPPESVSFLESIARDKTLGGGAEKQKQGGRPVGQVRKNIRLSEFWAP